MTIWSAPDWMLAQHVGQQDALPPGVTDIAAADRLRDAGQGDVVVDHGAPDQIVEREDNRLVHHAVDAQLPGGRSDLRHDQGRVDPVERRVRRIERRQTGDVQCLVGRQRRHRGDLELRGRWRGGAVGRRRACAETLAEQEFPADPGRGRGNGGDARCGHELAPVDGGRHRHAPR